MYNFQNNKKKLVLFYIIATFSLTSVAVYAATGRWEDASSKTQVVTKTLLADKTDWKAWKSAWNNIKTNYEQVSLAPGSDFSRLNFGWYSQGKSPVAEVRIARSQNMEDAKLFSGTCKIGTVIDGVQYYTNKVEATGFKPNRIYWYQVKLNGKWQLAKEYKTGNPHNFSFMYVGDPQIGASKGQIPAEASTKQTSDLAARNDAYNWNITLNAALSQHPEIKFLVSPGDQINEPAADGDAQKIRIQEQQYAGYLSAAALGSLPEATCIGNHDSMTPGYGNHFNVPNPFTKETSPTAAGHGYYYTYGNALFIVINANNYNAADHKKLIEKAIKANPKTRWRIVVMHQDIYGSGLDHSDSDGIILRTQLTPIYDANKIDVVLQGHDHTYARTYQLSSDGKNHSSFAELKTVGQSGQQHKLFARKLKDTAFKDFYKGQNKCYDIVDMRQGTLVNPKGVFYMSANSATGSKYYNLISQQQDYVAARSQTWRPTYSVIHITDHKFTLNTYDVATGKAIDDPYSIIKE